jgi:hypothetical protein
MMGRCLHVLPCFEFWLPDSVLSSFQSTSDFFTSVFLPHFLVRFAPFLCLKRLVCANCLLSWTAAGHYAPSLEVRWLIIYSVH